MKSAGKENMRTFMKNLSRQESRRNGAKSNSIYISGDLSNSKLRRINNATIEGVLSVKFSVFRKVFINDFNIGFRSPVTDAVRVLHV
jgi:hypothetical protein